MSDTLFQHPDTVTTGICSKCEGHKTWNHWYHHDKTLCDDCYYHGAMYKLLTKEEAVQAEKNRVAKPVDPPEPTPGMTEQFIRAHGDELFTRMMANVYGERHDPDIRVDIAHSDADGSNKSGTIHIQNADLDLTVEFADGSWNGTEIFRF